MPVEIFYSRKPKFPLSLLKRCFEELVHFSKCSRAFLDISLVGNKKILSLNKKYRRKKRVTDVLSFPLESKPSSPQFPWHLGEIVIAVPVATKQARQSQRTLFQQVVRLGIHGLIHLQGLDHEKNSLMERRFHRLETKYLRHLIKKGLLSWRGSLQFLAES